MDILKKLNEDGKTVIIVTHDKTCDNLCERKIKFKITRKDLYTNTLKYR